MEIDFVKWARSAGFHDFETNENGCYEDDFLQHCYLGWCACKDFYSEERGD